MRVREPRFAIDCHERGWLPCHDAARLSRVPAGSGSRGGYPPRLPQNRTYAVRIRLFGTAGYDPRRRPVCRPRIIPTAPVAATRGRRRAGLRGGEGRPRRSDRAWRRTRCVGPDRRRACGSAPTRTCVPRRAGATRCPLDAQLDEVACDRAFAFPVAQQDRAQPTPEMGVEFAHRLHLRRGGDPEEPVPAAQPRVDPGDNAISALPKSSA